CNSELHYVARSIDHREFVENGFVDFNPQAGALRRLHTSILADFKYGAEHVTEGIEFGNAGFEIPTVFSCCEEMQARRVVQSRGRAVGIDGDTECGCHSTDAKR